MKPVEYCLQILTQFGENRIMRTMNCEPYNDVARITYIFISLTAFFVPLFLNIIFYAQIIHALSNRLPNEVPAVNNVRNQVARVLVANGIVFFVLSSTLPCRYYQRYYKGKSSKQLGRQATL